MWLKELILLNKKIKLLSMVLLFSLCFTSACFSANSGDKNLSKKEPPLREVVQKSDRKDKSPKPKVSSSEKKHNKEQTNKPQRKKTGWLTFRGNAQRTGSADVKGPRSKNLKWVFRTQGRIYGDAAVTSDGETIYIGSHDNFLYSIDKNGMEKWKFDTKGSIWTSPTIAEDGTIYIGSDFDALFAITPEGKLRWKFESAPKNLEKKPRAGQYNVDTSVLLLQDGTLVFGCNNDLFALYSSTGNLRWTFTAGKGRSKIFSSPAASLSETIFFGNQGNYFFALNQSKEVLWYTKTYDDNDSTPVVDQDGNVFFGSDDGWIRAFSQTNEELWTLEIGSPIRAPLGLSQQGLLLAATYGRIPYVIALDKENGKEKWRFETKPGKGDFYGIQSGITTDKDGYVFFGARDHYIYSLTPEGRLLWKYETGDQVDSGPVLGPDGTLYIGSDDGRLYAFSAEAI